MRAYCDRRATRQWAKSGPPQRGCPVKAGGGVAPLVRATSPAITTLLATGLHRAITVVQSSVIWL